MAVIETTDDLLKLLDENPEFLAAVRNKVLTDELMKLPAAFAAFSSNANTRFQAIESDLKDFKNEMNTRLDDFDARLDALLAATELNANNIAENTNSIAENTNSIVESAKRIAENTNNIAENTKRIAENTNSIKELTRVTSINTRHIGEMRGLFVVQKVTREAALIADRMGLRLEHVLSLQDIIDIWNAGAANSLTHGISKDDEDSFKLADLIILGQTPHGQQCYIAVEISFTVNGRDTSRAIRNSEYITEFTGTPTYAAAAGMFKDDRLNDILTTHTPHPYNRDDETRVFWSSHEDIDRPH